MFTKQPQNYVFVLDITTIAFSQSSFFLISQMKRFDTFQRISWCQLSAIVYNITKPPKGWFL